MDVFELERNQTGLDRAILPMQLYDCAVQVVSLNTLLAFSIMVTDDGILHGRVLVSTRRAMETCMKLYFVTALTFGNIWLLISMSKLTSSVGILENEVPGMDKNKTKPYSFVQLLLLWNLVVIMYCNQLNITLHFRLVMPAVFAVIRSIYMNPYRFVAAASLLITLAVQILQIKEMAAVSTTVEGVDNIVKFCIMLLVQLTLLIGIGRLCRRSVVLDIIMPDDITPTVVVVANSDAILRFFVPVIDGVPDNTQIIVEISGRDVILHSLEVIDMLGRNRSSWNRLRFVIMTADLGTILHIVPGLEMSNRNGLTLLFVNGNIGAMRNVPFAAMPRMGQRQIMAADNPAV